MARIAFFGAGYAGLVSGACLAELGHEVVIRDVSAERIEALQAGRIPFHEPGLAELVERNRERLSFTLSMEEAVDRLRSSCSSASARRRPHPATRTCPQSGRWSRSSRPGSRTSCS